MMSTSDDSAAMPANMHDPLCGPPWSYGRGGHCEGCDLIAKARADERERAAQRVRDYGAKTHPPHSPEFGCMRCDIHAAYNHAAALIVRGES